MLTVDYDYVIENAKDGFEVLKIIKDNKSLYIGSKYDNTRDINKFLEQIQGEKLQNDVFIIYGFGLGEHIKALRKLYDNKIIVFEPNKKIYNYIKKMQWLKQDKNIEVICCEEEKLNKVIKSNINDFNYKNSEYLFFSNYNKVYHEEFLRFFNILNNYIVTLAIDVNTKKTFNKLWVENLIRSVKYMIDAVPSDLYDNKFKDVPAIIVSAGPSLTKNIDLLKNIHNMLIISGGRTLGPLMDKDILPHLLVVADSTERNYTLVKDYINKIEIPLLFSESANLKIVKEHTGLKLFYSYSELINRIADRKITHISTGGSVAHAMTSYAANLGCNPIIFIGQDFAYTGNKTHSEIAENKDGSYNYDIAIRNDDIYVEDVNGNKVRTSLVLDSQRRAMEQIIKLYPNTTFINASEGGAKIEGTMQAKLYDVIKKYNKNQIKKIELVDYKVDMKKNAEIELKILKEQLNNLIEIIKKQIELYKSEKNYTNRNEIDKIIKYCKENSIFEMLIYESIYLYLSTSQKDTYKEEYKFYCNVLNSLENGQKVLIEELEEIKKS